MRFRSASPVAGGRDGLVYPLQRVAPGHQLIEFVASGLIERHKGRHVELRPGGAHASTGDDLLREGRARSRDTVSSGSVDGRQSHHDRGTAARKHGERLLESGRAPHGDEGVVHAPAAGEVHDGGHRVGGIGVDGMGGAELPGPGSLESRISTAMMGSAPDRRAPGWQFTPTPPQPSTATLLKGATLARLTTAPNPVVTPQASRQASSSGKVSGTFTSCVRLTSDVVGEPGHPGFVDDAVAALVGEHPPTVERLLALAEVRAPAGAVEALPAVLQQTDHHAVAGLEVGDRAARLHHRSRPSRDLPRRGALPGSRRSCRASRCGRWRCRPL